MRGILRSTNHSGQEPQTFDAPHEGIYSRHNDWRLRQAAIPAQADFDLLIPTPSGPLCISQRDPSQATARLSIVLPTFNEAQNIEPMIRGVSEILERSQISYELIVVDDDSPDGTWSSALSLSASVPHLRVMRRINERGLATAVIRGWQASSGEVLGVLDADLQHPVETLPRLWVEIQSGADMAVGSRHVAGGGISQWSWRRRLISRSAQGVGLLVLPEVVSRLHDPMSGYMLVRRGKLTGVSLNPRGYKILIELLARCPIEKIAEVGYIFQERAEDQSKVTWRSYLDYVLHLGLLRLPRRLTIGHRTE